MLIETPICDFGWKAPDFTLKNAAGESFTMSKHMGEKGLLIVFICNHCPYVQRVGVQLAQDTKQLISEGVNVLAVMSNDYRDYPDDAPDKMDAFAKQYDFTFPYLIDEDQSIGKKYGAVCTPDFFGLNANGELQYRGRMKELLGSMRQVAASGNGPRDQYPSMGCSIKWTK